MKKEKLFVDTSAWIAVVNNRDQYHLAAGDFYKDCFNHYRSLISSNLVLAETYIILRMDCGSETALNWWDKLAASLRIEIIYADSDITGEAITLLKQYRDQRISLTDAVSFRIMERHTIREAFTFDSHFSTAGFIKLPY